MKKATRLIIEDNNCIIFVKRTKKINNKKVVYYTLPGGHLDGAEDWKQAGIREAKEELSVEVEIQELFMEEYNEDLEKLERFYFAKILKGKVKNGNGEEFKNMSIDTKYGLYEIVKLNTNEIGAYNILPISVKDKLVSIYA